MVLRPWRPTCLELEVSAQAGTTRKRSPRTAAAASTFPAEAALDVVGSASFTIGSHYTAALATEATFGCRIGPTAAAASPARDDHRSQGLRYRGTTTAATASTLFPGSAGRTTAEATRTTGDRSRIATLFTDGDDEDLSACDRQRTCRNAAQPANATRTGPCQASASGCAI